MKVLVVAAHPDDEVLGAGGTIPLLVERGAEVYVQFLAEGAMSRHEGPMGWMGTKTEVAALKADALGASHVLGINSLRFEGFPDNRMDSVPLLDVTKRIERIVDEVKPELILTHSFADLNIDHRITAQAVLTACRPGGSAPPPREILSFEIPSSTEWAFGRFGDYRPSVFFDVHNFMEQKLAALRCYDSEMRDPPHPRSPINIVALVEHRGATAGMEAAEAFECVYSRR